MSKKGWVYFARFGADGPIKIGCAQNPLQRVRNLSIASPVAIRLLGAMSCRDPEGEETKLHTKLQKHQVRGERYVNVRVYIPALDIDHVVDGTHPDGITAEASP